LRNISQSLRNKTFMLFIYLQYGYYCLSDRKVK